MILSILTLILFALYAALLVYYRTGWTALTDFKTRSGIRRDVLISVIIPARNEEANLPALLQGLSKQTYPSAYFEVIIVDDHSCDNTSAIVSNFPMTNLSLIQLAEHVEPGINSYKKKAIEVAIAQSKGELIVTTDADCLVKPGWLQTIAENYAENKPAMIIMPVAILPKGSLLSIFQALDFMTLQGVTGGAVHHKLHAMCNGANLAYTKEIFREVNGYAGNDSVASGDDMFLMNKIQAHHSGEIHYLKSREVIVSTGPMLTIGDFFNQRIRWASKTSQFNHAPILMSAAIVYFFNLMLVFLPFAALVNNEAFTIAGFIYTPVCVWLYILAAKIMVELFFLFPVARFFDQAALLFYFPLIQPFHILYTVIAGGLGKFGSYQWKGRKVK